MSVGARHRPVRDHVDRAPAAAGHGRAVDRARGLDARQAPELLERALEELVAGGARSHIPSPADTRSGPARLRARTRAAPAGLSRGSGRAAPSPRPERTRGPPRIRRALGAGPGGCVRSWRPVPVSRSADCGSGREAWRAGARPKSMPVSRHAPRVKRRTIGSMRVSPSRGISEGASATSGPIAHAASAIPSLRREPTAAGSRSGAGGRCVPVPLRARGGSPNSLCRAAERASRRCATLAQAIRSTRPTAPRRIQSIGRISPKSASLKNSERAWLPVLVLGYAFSRSRMMPPSSARAVSTLAPGASRPITRIPE